MTSRNRFVFRIVCVASALAVTILAVTPVLGGLRPATRAAGCDQDWPVVAHDGSGRLVSVDASELPIACGRAIGYATSETTIAITNTGAMFFSPANTENTMARSTDSGNTWQLTQPPQIQYTSLWNTVDPYVTVDRRTGRLFWVHVTGPTRTTPLLVDESPLPNGVSTAIAFAYGFQVYSTADDGRSWTTANYLTSPVTDWEKVFVGPPAPAGPMPSGYPDVVYVCGNSPAEAVGPGRLCYKSLDGARTFTVAGYVFPTASTPDSCAAIAANTGVVSSGGTLFHPVSCQKGAYVAVSRDEGASYTWSRIPGAPGSGSGINVGPLQLAIDGANNLYAMWVDHDTVFVSVSRDGARTWGAPLAASEPGVHGITLPALAAGPAGNVGLVYYGSRTNPANGLDGYLTETENALAPTPLFYTGQLNEPGQRLVLGSGFSTTPHADYIGVTYDQAGSLWAGLVKQLGRPDRQGNVATTGYVGRLLSAGTTT